MTISKFNLCCTLTIGKDIPLTNLLEAEKLAYGITMFILLEGN